MDKKQKLIFTQLKLAHPKTAESTLYDVFAVYENDKMVEVNVQPTCSESILNNMYVARVQNVLKNLNAAFVEIAPGIRCFLPLEDVQHPLFTKKAANAQHANQTNKKKLSVGDELVVQVVKEAMKSKDAIVSTNLSFAGEYLVLTSEKYQIGISSKLSKTTADRLRNFAQKTMPIDRQYGIIFRTNAANANENQMLIEFNKLKKEYDALMTTACTRTLYTCLRKEQPLYLKMLQDIEKEKLEEVLTDNPEIYRQLSEHISEGYRLRFYEDKLLALAKLYCVEKQLEDALKERIWLKSGANIIIQPTEALTVIDVNSGKNVAKKDKTLYLYQINVEAAAEIARQLRLRNISGIILVDFIDLHDHEKSEELLDAFRKFLKQDSIPTQLVDMTKLGLVELTRKKNKKTLAEQLK